MEKAKLFSNIAADADPGQILSGFQVEYKNPDRREAADQHFCPARESGGMLPPEILKIKSLRLVEITFPTNTLKITFFPLSHKLFFELEVFSNIFHSL